MAPALGCKHSEDTKRKISASHIGISHSPEIRLRISQKLKGRTSWNKGIPMTEIQKAHLSIIKMGKPAFQAKPSVCCNCHIQYYKKDGGSRDKNRKYCSFECYQATRPKKKEPTGYAYGIRNGNWSGGLTNKNKLIRKSGKYKLWRTSIFERDSYTCQSCHISGVSLNAHHIKSFSNFPELRFELSNGLTLCERCHSKTDNYKQKCKKEIK